MGNNFYNLGFDMGQRMVAEPYYVFIVLRRMLSAEAKAAATAAFYEGAEAGYKVRVKPEASNGK